VLRSLLGTLVLIRRRTSRNRRCSIGGSLAGVGAYVARRERLGDYGGWRQPWIVYNAMARIGCGDQRSSRIRLDDVTCSSWCMPSLDHLLDSGSEAEREMRRDDLAELGRKRLKKECRWSGPATFEAE